MRLPARLAIPLALLLTASSGTPARAADPGRWRLTATSRVPIVYYEGMTSDPRRNLYFDGIFSGLYRTDDRLHEQARNDDVIPPAVRVAERYNHIGDIGWDGREGGRLLLPLECYYPPQGNTCGTGAIGVADPETLAWRYYVKLDPAEIAKAMWVEPSPDGRLLWTSSGRDLLAYRAAEVRLANAGGTRVIRAVRRLRDAVPPVGITGAAFRRGRLLTAGQDDTSFQVWSIELRSGRRRLELERRIVGESEGLAVVRLLGGVLHWMVTPFDPQGRRPTYDPDGVTLLHFAPVPRLRLSVRPHATRAGRRTRFRFRVSARGHAVRGARVRFAGRRVRTGRRGLATLTVRFGSPGTRKALASKRGYRPARARVRVRPLTCGAAARARAAC
jgi:hypothetical protein